MSKGMQQRLWRFIWSCMKSSWGHLVCSAQRTLRGRPHGGLQLLHKGSIVISEIENAVLPLLSICLKGDPSSPEVGVQWSPPTSLSSWVELPHPRAFGEWLLRLVGTLLHDLRLLLCKIPAALYHLSLGVFNTIIYYPVLPVIPSLASILALKL